MFTKLAIVVAATMTIFVAATPVPSTSYSNQCNTGKVQCCNSVQDAKSFDQQWLSTLLGLQASAITGLVGANCSPITAVGAGGNSCSSQPVCCQNNNYNGVIAVGCSPVNLNP